MDRNELSFDEGDAKRILQRAAALDAKIVGRLSVDELKSVAREAGISETAVSMALAEVLQGTDVTPERPPRRYRLLDRFRTHILSALAAVFGLFVGGAVDAFSNTGLGNSTFIMTKAAAILLTLSIGGAARAIKKNRFSEFRLLNGLMWITFGIGYTIAHGDVDRAPVIAGAGWAISTGVGALLLGMKMYLGSPSAPNRTDEVNATAHA